MAIVFASVPDMRPDSFGGCSENFTASVLIEWKSNLHALASPVDIDRLQFVSLLGASRSRSPFSRFKIISDSSCSRFLVVAFSFLVPALFHDISPCREHGRRRNQQCGRSLFFSAVEPDDACHCEGNCSKRWKITEEGDIRAGLQTGLVSFVKSALVAGKERDTVLYTDSVDVLDTADLRREHSAPLLVSRLPLCQEVNFRTMHNLLFIKRRGDGNSDKKYNADTNAKCSLAAPP